MLAMYSVSTPIRAVPMGVRPARAHRPPIFRAPISPARRSLCVHLLFVPCAAAKQQASKRQGSKQRLCPPQSYGCEGSKQGRLQHMQQCVCALNFYFGRKVYDLSSMYTKLFFLHLYLYVHRFIQHFNFQPMSSANH